MTNSPIAKVSKSFRLLLGFVVPVLVLVGWFLASKTGSLGSGILASPAQTWSAFGSLLNSGQLADALWISLRRAAVGLLIGTMIGTALAVLCGRVLLAGRLLNPAIQAVRALPVLALVPLFITWFGIGEMSKVLMIALATVFPLYVNVLSAIKNIDPKHLELARALKLDRWTTFTKVLVPVSLPSWFVGLRYASGLSLVILVISEQINANSGLGYLMSDARTYFQIDVILVVIIIYGALGVVVDQIIGGFERWSLRWA